MYSDAELQLAYRFANAPINVFPYPHCYIENIFPDAFYADLQRNLPDPEVMIPIEQARPVKGYKERFVLDVSGKHLDILPQEKQKFWRDFGEWLLSGRFQSLALAKFQAVVEARFRGVPGSHFYNEMLLVEDITKYALGPHTDSPRKVVTMLFYLPKDMSQVHLGTSIYLPKDPNFNCPGGPHHRFENFVRMRTMPFKPNSVFIFAKTENSFHGVEPVNDPDTKRWLLLYDVYQRQVQAQAPQPQYGTPVQAQPAAVKFSF